MTSQQSHSAAKGCKTIQFGLLGPGGQLHPTSSPSPSGFENILAKTIKPDELNS